MSYSALFTIVLSTLFMASPSSFAKNSSKKIAQTPVYAEKTLSYYQWASLTTREKAKYIEGIRKIHLGWSDHQKTFKIGDSAVEENRQRWALLLEIMQVPLANAQSAESSEAPAPKLVNASDCGRVAFSLAEYNVDIQDSFEKRFELCTKDSIDGFKWLQGSKCSRSSVTPGRWAVKCPEKFQAFIAAQKTLSESLPDSITKQTRIETLNTLGKRYSLTANANRMREIHGTSPSYRQSAIDLPPGPKEEEEKQEEPMTVTPAAATETESADSSCSSIDVTCGTRHRGTSVESLRQSYRQEIADFPADKKHCVIAGFVSVLNSNLKCTPITNLDMGTNWSGSCESKQTMCNPVAFGFQSNGQPICVPLGQHVTSECVLKAGKLGNTPENVSKQLLGQSGIAELSSIKTEDFADLWHSHRSGLSSLCTKGSARVEFFCTECKAMNSQIRSMGLSTMCTNSCGQVESDDASACRTAFRGKSAPAPTAAPTGNQ